MFELTSDEFRTREQVNGTMAVTVSKSVGISLASPISLNITPLTVGASLVSFFGEEPDTASKLEFTI